MGCFRGCGDGGHKLLSKALPCVPLVTFYLLVIATTVAAPSVSAAVQKPSLTDEDALQQIAKELKSIADLLPNKCLWIKVQLSGFAGLFVIAIVTGVTTLYLVDRGRKRWSHWESLRPRPLEDAFTPLKQELSNQLDALGVQIAAAAERMARETACYANQVAGLPAQVANLQARIDLQMPPTLAMSTPDVEWQLAAYVKEVKDLRSDVAILQTQLDATRIADAEMNWNVDVFEERLRASEPHREDVFPDGIEGEMVTAAYVQEATCLTDSSALESISWDAK